MIHLFIKKFTSLAAINLWYIYIYIYKHSTNIWKNSIFICCTQFLIYPSPSWILWGPHHSWSPASENPPIWLLPWYLVSDWTVHYGDGFSTYSVLKPPPLYICKVDCKYHCHRCQDQQVWKHIPVMGVDDAPQNWKWLCRVVLGPDQSLQHSPFLVSLGCFNIWFIPLSILLTQHGNFIIAKFASMFLWHTNQST